MNYEELIAKKLSNEITPSEERELNSWLNSAADHQTIFARAKTLWDLSGNFHKDYEPDTNKEWLKFTSKVKSELPVSKTITLNSPLFKIAAGIIIIIASFFIFKIIHTENLINPNTTTTANNTVADSSVAEQLSEIKTTDSLLVVYLSDSSRVFLNKNSTLRYPVEFSDLERNVSLDGEAFFEIKHNGAPFTIACNNTNTKVLGTSFNVKGYANEEAVEVTVVTGRVEFSNKIPNSEKIILKTNEKGKFNRRSGALVKSKNKSKNFNWWETHKVEHKIKKFFNKIKRKIK